MASLWEQYKDLILERVAAVEAAAAALERGTLEDEGDTRQRAELEAHRLAGSLGSVGFPEGSRIASEIERLLRGGPATVQAQASHFLELCAALRKTLESPPA
ncbi:MAG TPA: Hpt domain-containing protein [Candidatus Methylomirabilis sp.]|nr:Hpt domain-containing protein [Candidatus Methylomirabilis sp.]